jgi:hypothetical protein
MKLFRLKHKSTGLYYTPTRDVLVRMSPSEEPSRQYTGYVKSNLSKTGKVYSKDPRKHITTVRSHLHTSWGYYYDRCWRPSSIEERVGPEDFELEFLVSVKDG